MDPKFSAIIRAEDARKSTEDYQEMAYQHCEKFLIHYISSMISVHAADGKTLCRVHTNAPCFPQGLTASKVMEHLASPLYQLGYEFKIISEFVFDIFWGKEKKDVNLEDYWEDDF